ncbi:effector-associated constant component EACC1 [Actinoplanes sp. CA-030573]|uniref:effector-associated constant component EACC1 n=1 Tax=Actinoplanes sp. CA-030573 TaxID=3239898 RepID=UPI003D8D6F0A
MQVRIAVTGRDADTAGLYEWLRGEPPLRGHIKLGAGPVAPGEMGASAEVVVQAVGAAVGGGALWAALANSVTAWLSQRRSDVSITVTGADGRQVAIDAKRVADPEALILQAVDAVLPKPAAEP